MARRKILLDQSVLLWKNLTSFSLEICPSQ